MKKDKKAFTLIELLAVIVILGVLALIGTMAFSSVKEKVEDRQYTNLQTTIYAAASKYSEKTGLKRFYVSDLVEDGLLSTKKLKDNKGKDISCALVEIDAAGNWEINTVIDDCTESTYNNPLTISVTPGGKTIFCKNDNIELIANFSTGDFQGKYSGITNANLSYSWYKQSEPSKPLKNETSYTLTDDDKKHDSQYVVVVESSDAPDAFFRASQEIKFDTKKPTIKLERIDGTENKTIDVVVEDASGVSGFYFNVGKDSKYYDCENVKKCTRTISISANDYKEYMVANGNEGKLSYEINSKDTCENDADTFFGTITFPLTETCNFHYYKNGTYKEPFNCIGNSNVESVTITKGQNVNYSSPCTGLDKDIVTAYYIDKNKITSFNASVFENCIQKKGGNIDVYVDLAPNSINLTFDLKDGMSSSYNSFYEYTVRKNGGRQAIPTVSILPDYIKAFWYWKDKNKKCENIYPGSNTSVSYDDLSDCHTNGKVEYEAVYSYLELYKLIFDGNGGTINNASEQSRDIREGQSLYSDVLDDEFVLEYTNHEFVGWSLTKDRKDILTKFDYSLFNSKNELRLYAIWEEIIPKVTYQAGAHGTFYKGKSSLTINSKVVPAFGATTYPYKSLDGYEYMTKSWEDGLYGDLERYVYVKGDTYRFEGTWVDENNNTYQAGDVVENGKTLTALYNDLNDKYQIHFIIDASSTTSFSLKTLSYVNRPNESRFPNESYNSTGTYKYDCIRKNEKLVVCYYDLPADKKIKIPELDPTYFMDENIQFGGFTAISYDYRWTCRGWYKEYQDRKCNLLCGTVKTKYHANDVITWPSNDRVIMLHAAWCGESAIKGKYTDYGYLC